MSPDVARATLNEGDLKAYEAVRRLFKNDYGKPYEMTKGQIDLFRSIYEKQSPRIQFECYTQYGKSDTVSMALALRATTFPEKWIILGGTKDKAGIIMNKFIKHVFENEYCLSKLKLEEGESLERLKHSRSKEHITFRVDDQGGVGEVVILSADARRKGEDAGDILIGHGGQNLIEDDAALIPDNIHGKAMRMLGGHKENFLLKITNSFGRNHAYKSSAIEQYDKLREDRPPLYMSDAGYKVFKIDYRQGIEEGRMDVKYVDEMRGILDPIMFGILYECKYPPSDMVDEQGWMPLVTEDEIEEAQRRAVEAYGPKRLGGDIAEGVNFNAFVLRQDNIARVHSKTLEKDLMKTAHTARDIMREENVSAENAFFDAIGVGAGVVSRLHEMSLAVNGVKSGEKPTERTEAQKKIDPIEFSNLRAEMYWKLKNWIRQGGALVPSPEWRQLLKVRYRENGTGKVEIMPKVMMRAQGLLSMSESTDIPDALALTFAPGKPVFVMPNASAPLEPYYPEIGF